MRIVEKSSTRKNVVSILIVLLTFVVLIVLAFTLAFFDEKYLTVYINLDLDEIHEIKITNEDNEYVIPSSEYEIIVNDLKDSKVRQAHWKDVSRFETEYSIYINVDEDIYIINGSEISCNDKKLGLYFEKNYIDKIVEKYI